MSKAKNGEVLENFVLVLLYCLCSIARVCWVGLKTATGENPKIKAIVPMGECRLKVVVETYGVGLNKFQAQKQATL